jgi:hypothetical protein
MNRFKCGSSDAILVVAHITGTRLFTHLSEKRRHGIWLQVYLMVLGMSTCKHAFCLHLLIELTHISCLVWAFILSLQVGRISSLVCQTLTLQAKDLRQYPTQILSRTN